MEFCYGGGLSIELLIQIHQSIHVSGCIHVINCNFCYGGGLSIISKLLIQIHQSNRQTMAMASAYGYHSSLRQPETSLFFFYDCEATGPNPVDDRIMEIAAVLYTKNLERRLHYSQIMRLRGDGGHFESLCHCTTPILPVVEEKVGLTLADLQNQPPLSDVLDRFCSWIEDKVNEVERLTGNTYVPVLVAHSGSSFDFPLLMAEVERSNSALIGKFFSLNLHFADTFLTCSALKHTSSHILRGIEKLGVEPLCKHFFPNQLYDAHRALPDARALSKLFSDSPLSTTVDCELRNTIENAEQIYDRLKRKKMKKKRR